MRSTMTRIVLLIGLLLPGFVLGEDLWLHTDVRNVRDLAVVNGELILATEGGLVEVDPETGIFRTFTTLDGLGGVGVAKLESDSTGGVWAAFDNRMLQRWTPENGVTHRVSTLGQVSGIQAIHDITLHSRGLFVSTNRGVAVLRYNSTYDEWLWFEEYRTLGSFSPDEPVTRTTIIGNEIWVATNSGIARGNLDSTNLNWINYTWEQRRGLPANSIDDIAFCNGNVYTATDSGLAQFDTDHWVKLHWRRDIYRLYAHHDTLCAVSSDGASWWAGRRWQRYGEIAIGCRAIGWDAAGKLWMGRARDGYGPGGIAELIDTTWISHFPSGPASNYLLDAHFSADGAAWFVGGKGPMELGLSRYYNGDWQRWVNPEQTGSLFESPTRTLTADRNGDLWIGSYGGGVGWFRSDGTVRLFDADTSTGAHLQAYHPTARNATLAPAVESDSYGNIWVVNRGALNGNILACIPAEFIDHPDSDEPWYYFHRTNFRAFSDFDLIAVDGRGRKWIASTANNASASGEQGVYVLEDGGTIPDSTDDRIWGPIAGLPSPEVLSLKWDPAGYIWAGSTKGAYYVTATNYDLSQSQFTQIYNMRDVPVLSIDIDAMGNKWFGSEFGVSVISSDMFSILRRISTNPPDQLPDERVQMVAVDPHSGRAYIGTSYGTMAIRTPYQDYGETIDQVTFEPNPFDPRKGRLVFTGSSLASGAGARIFTPDGRLIRKLSHDEAAMGWDGRDDSGTDVADGVYLILTHSGSGQAGQGKVAVLRK